MVSSVCVLCQHCVSGVCVFGVRSVWYQRCVVSTLCGVGVCVCCVNTVWCRGVSTLCGVGVCVMSGVCVWCQELLCLLRHLNCWQRLKDVFSVGNVKLFYIPMVFERWSALLTNANTPPPVHR